jgi:hypothetical protein
MSEENRVAILGDTYIGSGNKRIVIRSGFKLAVAWILFILLCGVYVYAFYIHDRQEIVPGRDNTVEIDVPEDAEYKKCDIDAINNLIDEYLTARTSCNQEALQALVTDSSEFDNMSTLENAALYIRAFNNTTCYIADGYEEGSYIVIELSNIAIANVDSEPLDVISFYVITDTDGSYKIDNGELTTEQASYVESVKASQDIQDIYIHVKENIDYLLDNDETFVEFYNLIN